MNNSSVYQIPIDPNRWILWMILVILLSFKLQAQDMREGFQLLEQGEFLEAKQFFKKILDDHPNDKTSLICYGRAIGLAGEPKKAVQLFNQLATQYPADEEVLLNQAEAWLWNKRGGEALLIYKRIIDKSPNSFVANLGLANSYATVQNYPEAARAIRKALDLEPRNGQARISKKFIILGLANQLASQEQKIGDALELIEENLDQNPEDQESLRLKANIQIIGGQYEPALNTLALLDDPLEEQVGRSTVLHLMGRDEASLHEAKKALLNLNNQKTQIQYFNSLLWNSKLQMADELLDSLKSNWGKPEILAAQARLYVYQGDFPKAIETYHSLLVDEPKSFEGNLGIADAFHALGLEKEAYSNALQTLDYFPGQQDAVGFIQKRNKEASPMLTMSINSSQSNDGSANLRWLGKGQMDIMPCTNVSISIQQNEYSIENSDTKFFSNVLASSISHQLSKRWKLNGSIGFFQSSLQESHYETIDIDAWANLWVNKHQKTTFGYYTEIQDFNQALLSQSLQTRHAAIKNSVFWKPINLGWYNEYYYSFYSDGNRRSLLFNSFYKKFHHIQFLKAGMNYLNLFFKHQLPALYYSPARYHQLEVFGGLEFKTKSINSMHLLVDAALGNQWSDGISQNTWRIKASVAQSINRWHIKAYAEYSTIAAINGNGFSYQNMGLEISFRITEKPLFYQTLNENFKQK